MFNNMSTGIVSTCNPLTPSQTKHPGFGSIEESNRKSCLKINKVLDIALSALGVLGIAFIAISVGAVVGLTVCITPLVPIGIAVGTFAILITTALIARKVYHKVINHPSRYKLDQDIITANESNVPVLGKYCKADLKVINSVDKSFEQKKELVRSAKQSIECSFNFAGGEKLQEFLGIIDERMEKHEKLKAHLILSNDLLVKDDYRLLEEYSKKWPGRFNYLVTNRQTKWTPFIRTEENHVKLLIVDGRYFGLGGSGIQQNMTRETPPVETESSKKTFAENFIDRSFRDTDLFGKSLPEDKSNIAQTMRGQFFNLYQIWNRRMGRKLKENEGMKFKVDPELASCLQFDTDSEVSKNQELKFIVGGPEHRGVNPIERELSKMIENAKKNVNIGNLMFNPGKAIVRSLKKVKRVTPEVNLVGHFNGKGPNSSLIHYVHVWPSRPNYRLLDTVYESQVKKQHYHKKVMTVDEQLAFVGSYNFGQKSSLCDYEVGCVIKSETIAKCIDDALKTDKENSKKINAGPKWKEYIKFFAFVTKGILGNLAG